MPWLAVVAVDMPNLSAGTIRRLKDAGTGHDGAVLVDDDGRRQLAFVVDTGRLDAVAPGLEERHGASLRSLLERLDLVDVAAVGGEHRDVDSWADLRELAEESPDDG
ncbi:NTP transferase domain-containing protein [Nocardioides sp. TF02-7]|uniref:molybdenum cofactor guanylyltransferase n=1 Tax=Nocardioides sp. TF02-7 TaxID=2917724 RepID=UPI0023DA9351|nr:NTP transferase domain-containing protein [Nocardioides sp. TF02-7]